MRRLALLALMCAAVGCGNGPRSERAYAAQLPSEVRPSYEVFAHRCSKCHSLSRALDSQIDDDEYWKIYVRRMRLQPGSGITAADEATVLQFLAYYAQKQRERKARGPSPSPSPTPSATAGAATPDGGAP